MHETTKDLASYQTHIDGLRAIAVLAVLFFHAEVGLPGGYVGVDVFFVISGYLITRLILKDLDAGHFQILGFWERRIRRILPALAVVVLATAIAGYFLFLPTDFQELGQSVFAQALLMSNVYFWRESGYFAQPASVKPLLHIWSLAVEEQFYLLFPVLLIVIYRVSRRVLASVFAFLACISLCVSVYCSYEYPVFNFYLLPTRTWELLVGSLVAGIPTQRPSKTILKESLSWLGLIAILTAVFCFDSKTRFPGISALLPCVGAALIILANENGSTCVGRFLAAPPLVFVGLISYSLYLWHWPLIVFARYWSLDRLHLSHRLMILLASVVLAVVSWRFLETPFRRRTVFKSRVTILSFGGIVTVLLMLTGLAVHALRGLPSRIPTEALQHTNLTNDSPFYREVGLTQIQDGNFIELGNGVTNLPVELFVWGDSHAMAALPILDMLCKEHSLRGVAATHFAATPLIGYEDRAAIRSKENLIAFKAAIVEFIRTKHVSNVILAARWDCYIDSDNGTDRLRRGVVSTINALQGSGSRIWIMRQVPKHRWNVPSAIALTIWRGGDPGEVELPLEEHRAEFHRQNPIFENLATQFRSVTVLDPTDVFVTTLARCRVQDRGKALYWDEQHLAVAGAMLLRPLFEPLFVGLGRNRGPIDTDR